MNSLINITALVKNLLESMPKCRNSDDFLYGQILKVIEFETSTDILSLPLGYFLENRKLYRCPSFETVRRARQKVQHDNPTLRASAPVAEARKEHQSKILDWVSGNAE